MDIKHYYENTELTLQQIADKLQVGYKRVFSYVKNNYTSAYRKNRKVKNYSKSKTGELNPMLGNTLENHPRYIGLVSDHKGYLMVVKPDWYTGRKRSHHVFAHHIPICEHYGITEIPRGWCVHHCDENPHNNALSNLVLMLLGDHVRLHNALKGATTISKESTAKWLEAHGTPFRREDIVCSA